ncbi:MAG: hypothetical protein ACFFAS_07340 [Promethearchaeota archaeon]
MKSLLSDMINNFKDEVERLNKEFSPEKTYKLLRNNEKGKLITFSLNGEMFLCMSEDDYFEIKYDEDRIDKEIIRDFNYTNEELDVIFKYFARHEFGHSKLRKIDNILDQTILHSSTIKKYCYTLLGILKEFYADWFVNKNFNEVPHKYIEEWAIGLSVDREVFNNPEFLNNISRYLRNNLYIAERFFIFNKWDILRDFYHNNNLVSLYNLLFKIFEKFEEICSDRLDLILIKEEIIKLAKKLDKIDYKILLKIES